MQRAPRRRHVARLQVLRDLLQRAGRDRRAQLVIAQRLLGLLDEVAAPARAGHALAGGLVAELQIELAQQVRDLRVLGREPLRGLERRARAIPQHLHAAQLADGDEALGIGRGQLARLFGVEQRIVHAAHAEQHLDDLVARAHVVGRAARQLFERLERLGVAAVALERARVQAARVSVIGIELQRLLELLGGGGVLRLGEQRLRQRVAHLRVLRAQHHFALQLVEERRHALSRARTGSW